MAKIKGWKKVGEMTWENEPIIIGLDWYETFGGDIFWKVWINQRDLKIGFRTKQEALDYAMEYMRSNPQKKMEWIKDKSFREGGYYWDEESGVSRNSNSQEIEDWDYI